MRLLILSTNVIAYEKHQVFAQASLLVVVCLVLGMISVGYVAAQTGSSTDESATSTVEASALLGEVAGEATTMAEQSAGPEGNKETAFTPVDGQETARAPVGVQEQVSPTAGAVSDIASLEQDYMAKYGRYLQVMPGNTLPSTESGSVQSKFGKALPESIRIDVYNSPHGVGYQIYYEEKGVAHSIG